MFWIDWPIPNLISILSLSTQAEADDKIPLLLKIPAAVRGLSLEPLLEKIDLTNFLAMDYNSQQKGGQKNAFNETCRRSSLQRSSDRRTENRFPGANMETDEAHRESTAKTLQKSSGRTRYGSVSDSSSDVRQCQTLLPSKSLSVSPLFQFDSRHIDGESQRRQQEKQSPDESGISDSKRANKTRNSRFETTQNIESNG